MVVWWFKMAVWVLQSTTLEIKSGKVQISKPCLILCINSLSLNMNSGISADEHTNAQKTNLFFLRLCLTHTHTHTEKDVYMICDFISQESLVHTLMWLLPLFCFSTESKEVYKRQVLSITSIAMAISLLGTLCMALYCRNKWEDKHAFLNPYIYTYRSHCSYAPVDLGFKQHCWNNGCKQTPRLTQRVEKHTRHTRT